MYSQEALDQRYHLRHVPEVRQMLLEWCAIVSIAMVSIARDAWVLLEVACGKWGRLWKVACWQRVAY